ncbi:hypothetical protein [Natronoarchaeum rubrum]|uniref:hypothetical protein n=1 Tax=Natronoarchaeum rubrum TaxID=755311 RepID=UPI002111E181|nr:hypothetical protein [Natronoarchaeum rubrum]
MSESEGALAEIADLVEEAQLSLDRLREEDDPEAEREDLQHLYTITQEAADLLETIDVSELPDTVDGEAVIAAVEAGELEAAIEEGDLGRAVDYKALLKAIDFGNLASTADITELVSEGKDLSDAVDDATEDDAGVVGSDDEAADDEDDGIVDGFDAAIGDDSGLGGEEGLGGGMGNVGNLPDEAYQVAIQQKAMEAVDEFRAGVLAAHDKLRALHEKNREQMRRQHNEQGTNSRNPTAHSTVVTDRGDVGGSATQHSTIPTGTKYSTAPTRTRIYGNRFERRRQANDTTKTDNEDRTGR